MREAENTLKVFVGDLSSPTQNTFCVQSDLGDHGSLLNLSFAQTVLPSLLILCGDVESNPGPETQLTVDDHFEVTQYLETLPSKDLKSLGGALGLRYTTLDKMTSDALCNELVLAWLNQQDNVMKKSGKPTWESLMKALRTIGHEGLAQKITQEMAEGTLHQIKRLKEAHEVNLGTDHTDHAAPQPATCKVHKSQTLELYCETCESLVCPRCVISLCTKKNHEYGYIDDMVEKYRTVLEKELEPIKTLHQQMPSALEVISTAERELKYKREEKLRKVETTFDTLSEILAEKRRYFTEAIENSFQEQSQNYSSKKSEILGITSELSAFIHSIEASCQNEPKETFVADVTNKKRNIKNMKSEVSGISPNPVKVPEMEITLPSITEFKELWKERNHTSKREDIPIRHMSVPILKPVEVTLQIDSGRKLLERGNKVTSLLECGYDSHSQVVDVKRISHEKFSLSFKPLKRGNHKLHIMCDDVQICGSPIPIYVTVDPREIAAVGKPQLRKFVRNAAGIKSHDQKIYVTCPNEALLIIFEGTSTRTSLKVRGVAEVLIINEYLFYTDVIQHRVVKANLNGTTISSIGTQGNKPRQFNYPNGIRLSKDGEIYVCDSRNHRVQVFDQDLKLLRVIGSQGTADGCFGIPDDLDFDEAGNIYVVEEDNHRVQVLTPQGQHIRYIGGYGNGKGELDNPMSAAVYQNMIYITDNNNKRISVFTTMGEFITTFGEGILTYPECIAIDDNGHIFVTDNKTHVVKF